MAKKVTKVSEKSKESIDSYGTKPSSTASTGSRLQSFKNLDQVSAMPSALRGLSGKGLRIKLGIGGGLLLILALGGYLGLRGRGAVSQPTETGDAATSVAAPNAAPKLPEASIPTQSTPVTTKLAPSPPPVSQPEQKKASNEIKKTKQTGKSVAPKANKNKVTTVKAKSKTKNSKTSKKSVPTKAVPKN